jgi:hypothetical protein
MGVIKKHKEINDEELKHCHACDKWKSLDSYNKDSTKWDHLDNKCIDCYVEYRKNNKEELSKKKKEYNDDNKDKIKEWKGDNKEHISEYNKKYKEENKEKVQAYYKKTDDEKINNKNIRREKYYNEFKELVEKKEGTCISDSSVYLTAHTKLSVQCKNKHEFETTLNNIKHNNWCTQCKK